jgi:hypothetical protein
MLEMLKMFLISALQGRQSRILLLNSYLEKFTILDCRAYGSQ